MLTIVVDWVSAGLGDGEVDRAKKGKEKRNSNLTKKDMLSWVALMRKNKRAGLWGLVGHMLGASPYQPCPESWHDAAEVVNGLRDTD